MRRVDLIKAAAWTIVLLPLTWLFFAFMMSDAYAVDYTWQSGTVGDEDVSITTLSTDRIKWSTGTVGDDSVNLLEFRATDNVTRTTGTIGDDDVDLWKWDSALDNGYDREESDED